MQLWPYLMLKGWLPYRDIAIAHNPLMLIDLSIFYKFFGTSLLSLKIFTWSLILLIDIFLFFIASKLWNRKVAIIAVAFYAIFQLVYEGNGLWFDLYLTLPALVLYYFARNKRYFWTGIVWALAFLVKQTAIWLLIPITISAFQDLAPKGIQNKAVIFVVGILLILFPTVMIIWFLGILPDYLFWAYEFGVGILPRASGQINLPDLRQFTISIIPFSLLLFVPFLKEKKESLILFSWIVFGALGAIPRFELFHFQPALPFLAVAFGLVFSNISKLKPIVVYVLSGYLLLTLVLVGKFYTREWGMEDRFFESEVLEVADYIKDRSEGNDKIYVLNAWDSVYALSNTLPAVSPWVPHLPWYMELPGVQEEIVQDLEREKPEMIVMREYTQSGLSAYKPELIDKFITENYEISDKINTHLILLQKE
ncbi:MAG: glycosyltransferase family 39 protein [Patescibacteria group bacterium]